MAFHLLERERAGGTRLARILLEAMERVGHCVWCRNLSEETLCGICANPRRDPATVCVVETPADVAAVEQAGGFRGRYFVLMGRLSPLDGIGPGEIGLDTLQAHLDKGDIEELILATNPTVEGEATAHYIGALAHQRGIRATRIAHGVPLGGELEYVDSGTLSHALAKRTEL